MDANRKHDLKLGIAHIGAACVEAIVTEPSAALPHLLIGGVYLLSALHQPRAANTT